MQVTVVVVTYSDRFHLLKQVIDTCLDQGVKNIIVVDNKSDKNSRVQLESYSEKKGNQIEVIWNNSNLGSAKAFKQGLVKADQLKSEFIWLLDDDNKPRKNALNKLIEFWKNKPKEVGALLSYRPDRPQYKEAVFQKKPNLVLSARNSFSGFHLKDKLIAFFKPYKESNTNLKFGEIAYAPYGGMFFERSILAKIGYPDEDFYLYSDDHDWSYRITQKGMKIYLLLESIIDDIDTSWAIKDKNSNIFKTIKKAPSLRVYYTIRNRMIFEKKHLVSSRLIYNFNRYFFTFILMLYVFNTVNYKVFLRAIKDAKKNNLVKF